MSEQKGTQNGSETVRKNSLVTLTVTDLNNLGYGVGHLADGRAVFVKGAVTGDEAEVRIIKVAKSYLIGKTERLLSPSPFRAESDPCSAAPACGGCAYRYVTYEHETERKRLYVENAFRKAGLPHVEILPVVRAGGPYHTRNKAQYPVKNTSEGLRAGFYASGTHTVVSATDCPLQPPVFGEILRAVCRFGDRVGVRAYEETTGQGLLRHIYLRYAKGTGQIMLCLVLTQSSFPREQELVRALTEQFPAISSVMLNVNRENTNVVLGKEFRCIYGVPYLEDILCGKRFRISPESFYQVHHDGAERLYGIAAQLAETVAGNESRKPLTLLDLYCGTGTIGLSMADRPWVGELIGIEIVPGAVRCAQENAERNGIRNARFYCGDASNAQALLAGAEAERGRIAPDVVILDPPRKGTTEELISFLSERETPAIVYISCDPDTLARDSVVFEKHGYRIGQVTPVDMFPRTGHVECVVLLTKVHN